MMSLTLLFMLCRDVLIMRLFSNADEDASNQRPDIFIRNPRGLGRQVIIDEVVVEMHIHGDSQNG